MFYDGPPIFMGSTAVMADIEFSQAQKKMALVVISQFTRYSG